MEDQYNQNLGEESCPAEEPVQDATQEVTQPEEEGASVTLDDIQEAASLVFIGKAKRALEDLEDAQKDKTQLAGEVKQCEKNYSNMEKNISESITVALKKRKEEIAASFDKELSQYQDEIDACKTERAKAKANAIAQKIQVETAPLNQQNQQLEAQIDMKFRENKVPAICKKRSISMLFFPSQLRDWIMDAIVFVAAFLVIPMFLAMAIRNPIALAILLFLYTGALFGAYLFVLHRFMLRFVGVNAEVEDLRKCIRTNNKNKQLMINRIKKSQDETGYHLGAYDEKISEFQQLMQETVARRQEALEKFENEVRHQITADITAANKDDMNAMLQQVEDKRQELTNKKDEITKLEEEIKETYESVFGKEILYKQKLNGITTFCQQNPDLSLEDALAAYKASKK